MSEPDPYDKMESEEQDAELRREHLALATELEDADIDWLMSGKRGRRVVCRILEWANLMTSSWSPNNSVSSMQEGKKQIGYWLIEKIEKVCPDRYHEMLEEKRKQDARD